MTFGLAMATIISQSKAGGIKDMASVAKATTNSFCQMFLLQQNTMEDPAVIPLLPSLRMMPQTTRLKAI